MISQLSKSFTFTTWARAGLFCPTWSGFDHAPLALTATQALFPPVPAREKEATEDTVREQAAAVAREQGGGARASGGGGARVARQRASRLRRLPSPYTAADLAAEIGRASCRERV